MNPVRPESRDVLVSSPAFHDLPVELVDQVFEKMQECVYGIGEMLIEQGHVGDSVMIVISGTAQGSLRQESGEGRSIGTFGPGDVVGEMALVTRQPRTADVVAESEVRVLRLSAGDFQEIAFQNPELGLVLTSIVAARLGEKSLDGMGDKVVGGFRIVRSVGRGGMGVVYEATDVETGERVALKMMSYRLLYERGAMARFQREAMTLQRLDHENIARVQRTFSAFKTSFIAMEFCDGPVLDGLLDERGPLDEAHTRRVVGQLASALHYMHELDVIHRDLKPNNVMLTSEGVVKLTDFGLAKSLDTLVETPLTEGRALLGTPLYMAPEQISGDPSTGKADVYALGCLTWELLHNAPPVEAKSFMELVRAKGSFKLPPARKIAGGVSDELHAFLEACFQLEPEDRNVDLEQISSWADRLDMSR